MYWRPFIYLVPLPHKSMRYWPDFTGPTVPATIGNPPRDPEGMAFIRQVVDADLIFATVNQKQPMQPVNNLPLLLYTFPSCMF
jgi:hypothetical protein